jgi:hypothetical protein
VVARARFALFSLPLANYSAGIKLLSMGKKKKSKTEPVGKPSSLIDTRVIYCGDNLDQLKKFPPECVDLIYIDFMRPRCVETVDTFGCCSSITDEVKV